jgi:hypothetical protein
MNPEHVNYILILIIKAVKFVETLQDFFLDMRDMCKDVLIKMHSKTPK